MQNLYKQEKEFHEIKFEFGENFFIQYKENYAWKNHWVRIMKRVKQSTLDASKVLNLGSGSGPVEFFMENNNSRIFSIDLSFNALENIKRLNLNNYIVNCTVSELPFKDETFESIVALNIFHHLSDFKDLMPEILRVSKNNSSLISLEPVSTIFRKIARNLFSERWNKVHSSEEKDLISEDLRFLKKHENIDKISIKPFSPFIPFLKVKAPKILKMLIITIDLLLETLELGWLYFISFRIKKK